METKARQMNFKMQDRGTRIAKFVAALSCACIALSVLGASAEAQTAPPSGSAMIGQVAGEDISVTGPSQTAPNRTAPSFLFASGSTIVVHSGQARVDLTGGGELDVCGPAKFTVLASGEAITIAIDFGRIHAKLDPSRPITIYTPLITATPLAVMSQPRDITFGLEPNSGAMCVLAAHGAVEVQQQLSGETLIVPEPSEMALRGVPLMATPAAAGSCRCEFAEHSSDAAPPRPVVAQQRIPVGGTSGSQASPLAAAQPNAPTTAMTRSVPVSASTGMESPGVPPPALPPSKPRAPIPPPVLPFASEPILKILAPPLLYRAKPRSAPAETASVATLILAKAAVVQPEWVFHGVVVEPETAKPRTKSAPAGTQKASKSEPKQASNLKRKKRGFWARFREFLLGSSPKSAAL
jgi:hypothetical protein